MKECTAVLFESLFQRYPALDVCKDDIAAAFETMNRCYLNGGILLTCGNGGSASDAAHIVGELMKGFRLKRALPETMKEKLLLAGGGREMANVLQQGIPAAALSEHAALTTAIANDQGYPYVFSQQVLAYGRPENCLLGISTSGNSANVLNAGIAAKAIGMETIALVGGKGGRMSELFDTVICVPASETDKIQELHLPVYHALCAMLEAEHFT